MSQTSERWSELPWPSHWQSWWQGSLLLSPVGYYGYSQEQVRVESSHQSSSPTLPWEWPGKHRAANWTDVYMTVNSEQHAPSSPFQKRFWFLSQECSSSTDNPSVTVQLPPWPVLPLFRFTFLECDSPPPSFLWNSSCFFNINVTPKVGKSLSWIVLSSSENLAACSVPVVFAPGHTQYFSW